MANSLFDRLTKEATSSREECRPGSGLNAGVWENHPDLMDEAAAELQNLKRLLYHAKGLLSLAAHITPEFIAEVEQAAEN